MRILVTYGSKRGGTEGIARMIGEAIERTGNQADVLPPKEVQGVDGYDAVIVGGALYANRWPGEVRRFVKRRAEQLRSRPVWFFSSGPLDDSPSRQAIPPTKQVQGLMERVSARGHVTFGGRLTPDARGFIASKMAKNKAGDWRDPERIRRWALEIVQALKPEAAGTAVAPSAFEQPPA